MGRARASGAARDLYRAMHWGKPARRTFTAFGPRGVPREVVDLGLFLDAELADGTVFPGPGERLTGTVWLCADRARPRRNIWLLARTGFMPGSGLPPGRMAAISYVSDKGDGPHTYRHEFEGVLPCLELDPDGHVVVRRRGSLYTVDWRGIVG